MSLNDNWYIVLELEFDPPVTDENIIKNKIEEKRRFWSTKFNDFKMGRQYKTWVDELPKIRRDMLGEENIRAELAKEACELIYKPIDDLIDAIETNNKIKYSEIEKISQKTKQNIDRVTKRALNKKIEIIEGDKIYEQIYSKYYSSSPSGAVKYQSLPGMLKISGFKDLYDFLYLGAGNKKYYEYNCKELLERTVERRKDFYKNDANSSNGQKICSLCELAFKNNQSKIEYDEYVNYIRIKSILDSLKTIAEISDRIKSEKVAEAIEEINEIYNNYDLSEKIVVAFLETEKIFYEMPKKEDKKSNQAEERARFEDEELRRKAEELRRAEERAKLEEEELRRKKEELQRAKERERLEEEERKRQERQRQEEEKRRKAEERARQEEIRRQREFDISSMKQRAKELLKFTKPNILISAIIYVLITAIYFVAMFMLIGYEVKLWYVYIIIMELLHIMIRSGYKLYCLKIVREEQTKISDIFLAFNENPLNMLLSGIIRDICYIIGYGFCLIGTVFPFYWFRFSVYIMKDEKINLFEAFGKSMKLLKGHYMELVKIYISNIGWYVINLLTCGIAGIYVKPFLSILYAEYYEHLKAQDELFG